MSSIYLKNTKILEDVTRHAGTEGIHVSEADRTYWSDMETRIAVLEDEEADEGAVKKSTFRAHVEDSMHIKASERTQLQNAYNHTTLDNLHVTKEQKDFWTDSINKLDSEVSTVESNIDSHLLNTYIHVTTDDKLNWDRKYLVPRDKEGNILGIPYDDFDEKTKEKIDEKASWHYEYGGTTLEPIKYGPGWKWDDLLPSVKKIINAKIELNDIVDEGTGHIKTEYLSDALNRADDINNHLNDVYDAKYINHINADDRKKWNNAHFIQAINYGNNVKDDWDYGLLKSQLNREVVAEIEGKMDIEEIIDSSTGHINTKYLSEALKRGDEIDTHLNDVVNEVYDVHVSPLDRKKWNNAHFIQAINYGNSAKDDWDYGLLKSQLNREVVAEIEGKIDYDVLIDSSTGHISSNFLSTTLQRTDEMEVHLDDVKNGTNTLHVSEDDRKYWNNSHQKIGKNYGNSAKDDWDYGLKRVQLDREITQEIEGKIDYDVLIDSSTGHISKDFLASTLQRTDEMEVHLDDVKNGTNALHITEDDRDYLYNSHQKIGKNYGNSIADDWDYGLQKSQLNRELKEEIEGAMQKEDYVNGSGIIYANKIDQKRIDHYNLINKGNYSHADLDYHIENDNIHNSSCINKWDYRGTYLDGSVEFSNTIYNSVEDVLTLAIDGDSTNDEVNNPSGAIMYFEQGYVISPVYDTTNSSTPFQAIDFYGTYDSLYHDIKIYTRTGKTEFFSIDTDENGNYYWEQEWVETDYLHNVHSINNRYIQIKVEISTSDPEVTPRLSRFTLFYGNKVNEELELAQGDYDTIDDRFLNLEERFNIELAPTEMVTQALEAIFVLPQASA